MSIPSPPVTFDLEAFAGQWFHWRDVTPWFWPRAGGRSERVNRVLAPVRSEGGVYFLAWSPDVPAEARPKASEICYIGETVRFKNRMTQFSNSAGFNGDRKTGHNPAMRWPEGRKEHLWVAFFKVVEDPLQPHVEEGLRRWMEAVALEEHRLAHGALPQLNVKGKEPIAL